MRLLIIGSLSGPAATKLAGDRGTTVTPAVDTARALAVLRAGHGADLLMVDVAVDIGASACGLEAEHIDFPIIACGTQAGGVAAIHSGARRSIPLPPNPELIAAVLAGIAGGTRELIDRDDAMARVVKLAQQVAPSAPVAGPVSRALVGRTVAEVERDLILETLKHCLGNRTHAANVLGIAIRTLRNKLNEYAADGVPVPPPGGTGGEPRAAA
jgi:DNA-binding NtrC family response regulator